jgi:hypothetical protein
VRAKRPQRLPVVLNRAEISAPGRPGRRDMDHGDAALRCRTPAAGMPAAAGQDIDFGRYGDGAWEGAARTASCCLYDSDGASCSPPGQVRAVHQRDLNAGLGRVRLPDASQQIPAASREWGWQWVFQPPESVATPATASLSAFTSTNRSCKGHSCLFVHVKRASQACWAPRCVIASPRTSSPRATTFEQFGASGQGVTTTMIYAHVLNRGGRGVVSPADRL